MIKPKYLAVMVATACACASSALNAQTANDRTAVVSIADSALAAITRGDTEALAELMIAEALTMPIRDSTRYGIRSREQVSMQTISGVIERGFRPEVHIAGALAVVWLPYDLYVNGEWSHCGIDAFTLVKTGATWKIAMLAWTTEQPPSCERHPDGPPRT